MAKEKKNFQIFPVLDKCGVLVAFVWSHAGQCILTNTINISSYANLYIIALNFYCNLETLIHCEFKLFLRQDLSKHHRLTLKFQTLD